MKKITINHDDTRRFLDSPALARPGGSSGTQRQVWVDRTIAYRSLTYLPAYQTLQLCILHHAAAHQATAWPVRSWNDVEEAEAAKRFHLLLTTKKVKDHEGREGP